MEKKEGRGKGRRGTANRKEEGKQVARRKKEKERENREGEEGREGRRREKKRQCKIRKSR